jgi:6-pyruvoyltetrahydropterin/6-carboxytetrahydropterin synthase
MKYACITKIFRFDSAHQLPLHHGKCARMHGHSYRLEVTLRGLIKAAPEASDHGMVMDFGDISYIVRVALIERIDHQNLNEVTGLYTTAENLVHWMWDELVRNGLPQELLYRIRLWETESCYAEITQQEHP